MRIFLTGAPASGKTTLGQRLAAALKTSFVDLDAAIVARAGRSISEIFAQQGEENFRRLESAVLRETVSEVGTRKAIIALGGGTLLAPENRALCEAEGRIVCLETPSGEELERRLGAAAGTRPLGDRSREREAHYASFPNRLSAWFDLRGESLVLVGKGLAQLAFSDFPIVADATVAALYEGLLPKPTAVISSGEAHKTIETVASIWSSFAAAGIGRSDTIVAVGGGVTGDLAGFAAATFMRGIDWINIPTTLLSMVDASTGGQTGCDLPEGKNLAVAFHSPRLVLIDIDFLKTLPPAVRAAGRAEMIKHELIGGRGKSEIAANLSVKIGIVESDPFERLGRRILLNCGHTVAHAIEKATDYRLSHGEAVAIGCVEEAKIAVRLALAPAAWPEEVAARFAAENLPTALPDGISLGALLPLMAGDKKKKGSIVTFALPCGWGDVRAVPIDLSKGVP